MSETANGAIRPVIMCGGTGTRLWPASRGSMPKQFIPLLHDLSTFQTTVLRVVGPAFARPVVIAADDSRFIVAEQLRAIGVEATIILKPVRRDSAAAVAVAARHAYREDDEAVILVLASDHEVTDATAFAAACERAAAIAREGRITTLGIAPTRPATGYGYIRPGAAIPGTDGFRVDGFVEKPDADTATRLIGEGYLWNSGNLVAPAWLMIDECIRHASDVDRRGHRGTRGRDARPRLPPPRRGSPRQVAIHLDRQGRHGTHRPRRGAARRPRVVGRRHLGRRLGGLGARRGGNACQGPRRGRRDDRQPRARPTAS